MTPYTQTINWHKVESFAPSVDGSYLCVTRHYEWGYYDFKRFDIVDFKNGQWQPAPNVTVLKFENRPLLEQ